MYGFTFNSIHSSDHGVVMKSKNRQVLPTVNDIYQQIPGRNGSYLFAGELADRMIEIECSLLKTTFALLRSGLRDIAAWLYQTERKALVFDDEPAMLYDAKVEGSIDFEQVMRHGKFNLVFRCAPLAYTAEVTKDFAADAVVVNNTGNYASPPIFTATFINTAAEWKVTLGTKYIRIVHDFAATNVLIVNCETGLISINGTRAMEELDWSNSVLFSLAPGNNEMAVLPAGKCTTTVKYKPRWL